MTVQRSRSWFERGTLRKPGPHLDRMPIGIDLAGVSLAEGLRAAVASGLVVLLSVWLHSAALLLAAFAANLTCFCDAGGPLAGRVKALFAFTLLGAAAWMTFGLLRNLPWPVVVPFAGAAVFLCSMARVWGAAAQAVGNVLIVTVALSLDAPLGLHEALNLGASFVGGGLWAVLLTLVIWRLHPSRPVTLAVNQAWGTLSALAADLRDLATADSNEAAWDAHARAHRRATRATLDEAHRHMSAIARSQGSVSMEVRRAVIRLETAEIVFGALIALSHQIEGAAPEVREAAARALRLLRPIMSLWGQGLMGMPERFEPVLERIETCGHTVVVLAPLLRKICDALRVMVKVSADNDDAASRSMIVPSGMPGSGLAELFTPLRENLTWNSAILRHAVRATVLTVPAFAWSLAWWSPYAHWLSITVALTMQPYFAATWQRVLERIGGTVLGGLMGAAMSFLPTTELTKAVLLVPLCVIGFSVRQVSYGAYIACLTPLVVVLFDVAEPGHGEMTIAAMRFTYTVAGGLLALAASLVLWPNWDSRRLGREIGDALFAYAAFAEAVFAPERATVDAQRNAGVANNNLEAALSRALQEPRHVRTRDIEAGLLVDAALRRLGGGLLAFRHEGENGLDLPTADARAWSDWLTAALRQLAAGRTLASPPPGAAPTSTLARLRRIVETMESALGTSPNS